VGPSPLARPIAIGGVQLRNRLLMAPITTNYADERGTVTEKTLGFYEERARGGAGALIFEAVSINPRSRLVVRQHGLHDDAFIPGLREVTRRVHGHGAAIFVQLCHGGPKAGSAINGLQPVSASEVPVKVADIPRAITREEISQAIEDFALAAQRAREAGFDGVELHAAHFYLLSAFLSGYLNRRTDEYGGSVENRSRLTCQVVQAVKRRAGEDYPVICRIHGRESLPGGIDEAEARLLARLLAGAAADALHISAAIFPVNPKLAASFAIQVGGPPSRDVPSGCYLPYAAGVKQAVGIPVIAVGKLNEPSVAEGVVRDGVADAVAIGRGLIADPYLPEKVLAGRWDEIVRCEDCLLCHTTLQTQRDVECSVSPRPWEPKGPQP
jgi:2,4-dienoyl-CoA reductase-like NADH-dependent reductase (Old Yellow Enzyme family)